MYFISKIKFSTIFIIIISLQQTESYSQYLHNDQVITDIEQLPIVDGHLATNLLLFSNSESCKREAIKAWDNVTPSIREAYPISGNIHLTFFGTIVENDKCSAVCLSKGLRYDLIAYPTPSSIAMNIPLDLDASNAHELSELLNNCQDVEVGFASNFDENIEIYSMRDDGSEGDDFELSIEPGENGIGWLNSRLGCQYYALLENSREMVAEFLIEYDSFFVIGPDLTGIRDGLNMTGRIQGNWFCNDLIHHSNLQRNDR